MEQTDEKTGSASDILKTIDFALQPHSPQIREIAVQNFMRALDYYIERHNQAWVR